MIDEKKTKLKELSKDILPYNTETIQKFTKWIGDIVARFPICIVELYRFQEIKNC